MSNNISKFIFGLVVLFALLGRASAASFNPFPVISIDGIQDAITDENASYIETKPIPSGSLFTDPFMNTVIAPSIRTDRLLLNPPLPKVSYRDWAEGSAYDVLGQPSDTGLDAFNNAITSLSTESDATDTETNEGQLMFAYIGLLGFIASRRKKIA